MKSYAVHQRDVLQDAWQHVDLRQPATYLSKQAGLSVLGAAIATASAFTLGRTMMPEMLRISKATAEQSIGMSSIPFIGDALNFATGGGVLGSICTAATLLSVALTLVRATSQGEAISYWTLTHAAIGLALAPLTLPGLAPSMAFLVIAGCTAATLSLAVTSRLVTGNPSYGGTIIGVLGAIALGPMGSRLAMGDAMGAAIGSTLTIWTLSGLSFPIIWLYNASAVFKTDDTSLLNSFRVVHDPNKVLDIPEDETGNVPKTFLPTIVGTSKNLIDKVKFWHAKLYSLSGLPVQAKASNTLDLEFVIFAGAAGSGKTVTAVGIANYLKAFLYAPRLSEICKAEKPSAVINDIFTQADIVTKNTGNAVVILFDEGETLFGDRSLLLPNDVEARKYTEIVNALNAQIQGAEMNQGRNIVVILCTNNVSAIDTSSWQRATVREIFSPPTSADISKMLESHFGRKRLSLYIYSKYFSLNIDRLKKWTAQIHDAKLAGRDVEYIITDAFEKMHVEIHNSRMKEIKPIKIDDDKIKEDYNKAIDTFISEAIDKRITEEQQRKAEQAKSPKPPQLARHAKKRHPAKLTSLAPRARSAKKLPTFAASKASTTTTTNPPRLPPGSTAERAS